MVPLRDRPGRVGAASEGVGSRGGGTGHRRSDYVARRRGWGWARGGEAGMGVALGRVRLCGSVLAARYGVPRRGTVGGENGGGARSNDREPEF